MNRIIAILISMSCLLGCSHLQPSLMNASKSGNIDDIKAFIKSGSNINEKDAYGRTPLMNAIWQKKTEAAKYLIESGADVKIKDVYGYDALIMAVDLGPDSLELIEPLLDNGADIESRDPSGWTPLMHTVNVFGSLNTARLLIKRGANLHAIEPVTSKTLYELALFYRNPSLAVEFKEAVARIGKEFLGTRIVFIREYNLVHATRWADISVGEHTVSLHNKNTNFIDVIPGKCVIVIKGSFGEGENKISFEAKAGRTYYFEVSPRTGNVVSTIGGGLVGRSIEALAKGDKAGPFEINPLEESVAEEKIRALK